MSAAPTIEQQVRVGDLVRIRFGSKASQLAVIAKRTAQGNLHAYKFSAKRRVWKGPIRLWEGEIMNRATSAEMRGLPAPPIAWRPS